MCQSILTGQLHEDAGEHVRLAGQNRVQLGQQEDSSVLLTVNHCIDVRTSDGELHFGEEFLKL